MQKEKRKSPIGKAILMAIIILVVIALLNPEWLFFLGAEQQQAVAEFSAKYFGASNPFGGGEKPVDPMSFMALVLLAAGCWAISGVIGFFHEKIKFQNRHTETIKGLAVNCIKYAVVIFGLIFGLSIMGVNMVGVIASLGILGLVVGFGAQTLIEDVITGLFVIFEGQFHVGDIVTIDGFRGAVTTIGIRTTCLMDVGGNVKIINNSDIRTITNLSDVASVAVAQVGISYSASIPAAEAAIEALLERLPQMYPDVFAIKPDYVGVQALSDSSVDLKVVGKVDESVLYRAQRLLNRELKLCLDEAKIEIPFPQMVIHQGAART